MNENSIIEYAFYPFRFGVLKIGYENGNVVYLGKTDSVSDENIKTELTDKVYEQITEYLIGKRQEFDFPFTLNGTEFQKKVWAQLQKIPYGETRTYKDIAVAIGSPKSSRAVGMANNKNPVMIVVPCHRVIGSNGKLMGYAGGTDMKETLLKIEKTP